MQNLMDESLSRELRQHLDRKHPCVVCSSEQFSPWAEQDYLKALQCRECGMISVNPHFTDEGLHLFYSKYFAARQEDLDLKAKRDVTYEIDRKWIENFAKKGRVLDVGCSGGFFLSKFSPDRWQREGVEIGADAAAYAKATFGIPVKVGYVVDIPFDKKFDLVMMRGVIEHFRDPVSVLEKCASLLETNGHLYITATPAGDSFAFNVYREKWRLFTPYEHIHFFSLQHLTEILKRYGMEYVAHNYQYAETPYANPASDFERIQQDIQLIRSGKGEQVEASVPFPGSMLTACWRKI